MGKVARTGRRAGDAALGYVRVLKHALCAGGLTKRTAAGARNGGGAARRDDEDAGRALSAVEESAGGGLRPASELSTASMGKTRHPPLILTSADNQRSSRQLPGLAG